MKITPEQAMKEFRLITERFPRIKEIFAIYSKWRLHFRELGISENSAHKKASFIIIRDYPVLTIEEDKFIQNLINQKGN